MVVNKGDFIEVEFTGKIKNDEIIFDSNVKSVIEKENLDVKDPKPFILCVGQSMFPKGLDLALVGKEVKKDYNIELKPENAFGKRDKNLIKMIPTKLFLEQNIRPERGMQLSLDGRLVRILSNSGGRTLVDFNNPLAGKEIIYDFKINRIVNDDKEKINALQDFFFRKQFDFKIEGEKIIFNVEKELEQYLQMFVSKIKEMIGKDVEIKVAVPSKVEEVVGKKEE